MSKLTESQIRRMLQLANLKPAVADRFLKESVKAGNVIKESAMGNRTAPPADPRHPASTTQEAYGHEKGMEELEEMDVEMDAEAGGEVSPEVAKKVIQAVLSGLGIEGTVTDEEGGEEEEDAGEEDMGDEEGMDGGEEEVQEAYDELEELEESAEEEELEEARNAANEKNGEHPFLKKGGNKVKISESLTNRVVDRVTARLIAEAAAAKKKGEKVLKGEEKKDKKEKKGAKVPGKMKKMKEARNTAKEKNGQHPLLSKGQNKTTGHKVKEGHKMSPVKPAKKK